MINTFFKLFYSSFSLPFLTSSEPIESNLFCVVQAPYQHGDPLLGCYTFYIFRLFLRFYRDCYVEIIFTFHINACQLTAQIWNTQSVVIVLWSKWIRQPLHIEQPDQWYCKIACLQYKACQQILMTIQMIDLSLGGILS